MGANDRAVNHPIFHVGISGKMSQHAFPNPVLAPASEAFEHAVPVAILTGQQAPLSTATAHPLDRFDETSATGLVSHIGIRVLSQKVPNLRPLFVGYVHVAHALTLNDFRQTSTEPNKGQALRDGQQQEDQLLDHAKDDHRPG